MGHFYITTSVMASKIAILIGLVGLASASPLVVWNPPITSPTAHSVWPIGSVQNVTWDITNAPPQITNNVGRIILTKGGILDLDHPLATDFPILQGSHLVTVPHVKPGHDYTVIVFGDSGNNSPKFKIVL